MLTSCLPPTLFWLTRLPAISRLLLLVWSPVLMYQTCLTSVSLIDEMWLWGLRCTSYAEGGAAWFVFTVIVKLMLFEVGLVWTVPVSSSFSRLTFCLTEWHLAILIQCLCGVFMFLKASAHLPHLRTQQPHPSSLASHHPLLGPLRH